MKFSVGYERGNERYFCSLLIASRSLVQSMLNSIDFYKAIFACYSCSYHSSMDGPKVLPRLEYFFTQHCDCMKCLASLDLIEKHKS